MGMPTISDDFLNCVFYLYPSREDAEKGTNLGGTGFFFSIDLTDVPGSYYYAVTNWHVAVQGGASVIRVNKRDGSSSEILGLDPHDWVFKRRWHDLAIADIALDLEANKISFIGSEMLVSQADLGKYGIGVGEDVFMVGRFMDHDGGETNVPAVRFGNIAVMPQPIEQPTGAKDLPSYILDVHSRSGYSGSPVFAFHSKVELKGGTLSTVVGNRMMKFLGVHWGQFPERWEIESGYRTPVRRKGGSQSLPVDEPPVHYVKGFSGMTLAIPADAITELLEMPKLKEPRERALAEVRHAHRNDPVAEAAEPEALDGNPRH
ncbi:MAG: serine protease [Alphaproteobacteria bacterium]|nr:serine protease [Alphaproteobacteria bacterium]